MVERYKNSRMVICYIATKIIPSAFNKALLQMKDAPLVLYHAVSVVTST
jgi:hypothetical protein